MKNVTAKCQLVNYNYKQQREEYKKEEKNRGILK